jgi:type II secretory pathway component PulF
MSEYKPYGLEDEDEDASLFVKGYRSLVFPKNAQVEFVKHYLDLKFNSNSDRSSIEQMLEIYRATVGESAAETQVCNEMLVKLKNGFPIVDAMRGWFADDFLLVFSASLNTSRPVDIIEKYMVVMDSFKDLLSVLWKKLLLPLVLLSGTFAMIIVLGTFVVPTLVSAVDATELTMPIKTVTAIASFVSNHGLLLLMLFIAISYGYRYASRNLTGGLRDQLDHTLFTIPTQITSAKFFAMLSLLLEARMGIKRCLEILHGNMTPYVDDHIRRMLEKTQKGSTNMQQLDTGLLDSRLKIRLRMASIQNASGNDKSLSLISQFAVKDVSSSLLKIAVSVSMVLWLSLIVMFAIMFNAMFDAIMLVSKFTS